MLYVHTVYQIPNSKCPSNVGALSARSIWIYSHADDLQIEKNSRLLILHLLTFPSTLHQMCFLASLQKIIVMLKTMGWMPLLVSFCLLRSFQRMAREWMYSASSILVLHESIVSCIFIWISWWDRCRPSRSYKALTRRQSNSQTIAPLIIICLQILRFICLLLHFRSSCSSG